MTNPTAAGGGVGVNDPGRNVGHTLAAGITTSLLSVAVFYAQEHGFHVFPCRPYTKDQDRKAKAPFTWHGCLEATTDLDMITRWWTRWPPAAIGINCGRSGLVVIDCDRAKPLLPPYDAMPGVIDGEDVLSVLAEQHGFPWTRSVRTASGGVHYYYRAPIDGDLIGPSQGKLGPMIDVRAGESYVIAAGSWADGTHYTVLDRQPIQPLPDWLAQMARREERKPAQTAPESIPHDGFQALRALVNHLLGVPVGQRNGALYWAARRAAGDVAAGRYTRDQGETALIDAGTAIGLGSREAVATVRSGLRRST
jgi:Bifunctional DNA primase/polymerase, N-terminal